MTIPYFLIKHKNSDLVKVAAYSGNDLRVYPKTLNLNSKEDMSLGTWIANRIYENTRLNLTMSMTDYITYFGNDFVLTYLNAERDR